MFDHDSKIEALVNNYGPQLLMEQNDLDDEVRKQFFNVVMRNAQLLKGFIDQIFEMSYLDSGEVKVNKEAFSLSELMGNIVAKYQIKLKEK